MEGFKKDIPSNDGLLKTIDGHVLDNHEMLEKDWREHETRVVLDCIQFIFGYNLWKRADMDAQKNVEFAASVA